MNNHFISFLEWHRAHFRGQKTSLYAGSTYRFIGAAAEYILEDGLFVSRKYKCFLVNYDQQVNSHDPQAALAGVMQ